MTLTPEARTRIDERIQRLATAKATVAARDELRQHVVDAATDAAQGRPVKAEHVDEAFAGLGSDEEIRATFFPTSPRLSPDRLTIVLLAVATAIAVGALLTADSGHAYCSVEGPGSCEAYASGDSLDLTLWGLPPLAILALLAWAPAWTAVAGAGLYALLATLRALSGTDTGDDVIVALGLVAAAALSVFAAIRHLRKQRGAAHA